MEKKIKSAQEILKDLGFKEKASDSVKKAFLQNLLKSASLQSIGNSSHKSEQLSFDFELEERKSNAS